MREVVLPICVLFVLATLLLPMPSILVDFLLVANILLALLLLVSTLYVSNPLKLSALPSILLLVTMYRLALNVSTTRMILSGQNPGELISAFGSVVVQGNLAVGIIIFLVITLVQFIVIAKGSERVAEVAARFTLDALPGKQMSIDADIRSGLIDLEEGARRRQTLQLESRFYGALDGSMKFVKGDAIAGLVITFINLIGGITLGLVMFDLSLTESVTRFSLYTVGDGLISQIPALLNSLAAGMVVTYVGHGGEDQSLSKALVDQIGQVRAVKLLIACLALFLAFAPGLPTWPFLILGLALGLSGLKGLRSERALKIENNSKRFTPRPPPAISIALGRQVIAKLEKRELLVDVFEDLRQELFDRYGLIALAPDVSEHKDQDVGYQIAIKGITVKEMKAANLESAWIQQFQKDLLAAVQEHRLELVDDIMTRRLLDYFDDHAPELISRVVPELATVTTITEVLRALIAENISVRSFELVLQALAEHARSASNSRELVEFVRLALKRTICEQLGLFQSERDLYQLAATLDLMLLQVEKQGQHVEPNLLQRLTDECSKLPADSIIICLRGSRRFLKECLLAAGLKLDCVAIDELCATAHYKVVGVIGDNIAESDLHSEAIAA